VFAEEFVSLPLSGGDRWIIGYVTMLLDCKGYLACVDVREAIVCSEYEEAGEEAVLVYFDVLLRHSPGWTEDNDDFRLIFQPDTPRI
jgi:hypothetical protein